MLVYLDVHSADGRFVRGLQASELSIQENGVAVPVGQLEELHPGVQLAVAVNPGIPFGIRNGQGLSRYELAAAVLGGWAKGRQGSSIDDLNLIITGGPERTHFSDPIQLSDALMAYSFEETAPVPSLDTLSRAVDIVSDATPRPGMERAILFVTAPLQGDVTFGLQDLAARIRQQGIHVFIWYVTSPVLFDTPEARLLTELAVESGGRFAPFSGDETLENPEYYLQELRDIYRLEYQSQASAGGQQSLMAEVNLDDLAVQSPVLNFELNLEPPDPAFILPSLEILRQPPQAQRDNLWEQVDPDLLQPQEHLLQVLVDFPDGRPRPLVRTALYVDGTLVDENTEPPFDSFVWDLREYVASGQHVLKVEALDSLGLTGASIDTLVQVNVDLPAPNPLRALAQRWPVIAGLGTVLVGALVLLGLLLAGKINPKWPRLRQGLRRSRGAPGQASLAVPGQTAEMPRAGPGAKRRPEWVNRFHWPQRRLNPQAYAYLTPISEAGEPVVRGPISITTDEITFGADPQRATLVLADPSVEALHARMLRGEGGAFSLIDEGSVAGTWINYLPVSEPGTILEQGDLIHLGRVCFRFTKREPQRVRKPIVTVQEMET